MKYLSVFGLILLASPLCLARPDKGIIPPPPGDQCVSPNGKGLGLAVRELAELVPAAEVLEIYMTAVSNDEEVIRVMEYLSSDAFHKIVTTMQNKKEFSQVMEYLCEDLHFDAYFYLNALGWVLGMPDVTRPPRLTMISAKSREGFNGMLKDLYDALPHQTIKETWERLYTTDEFLQKAMEKLGSEEFRVIGDAIEELPEYQDLLQKLRDIGVDADGILKAIMDFMGWRPHIKPTKSP